jgi:hypothetical protein
MTLAVVDCPIGCLGFDSWSLFSADQYKALRALGFRFGTHYLDNLTLAGINNVVQADLMLNVVQASHPPNWEVTPELGAADGTRAVRQAAALLPPLDFDLWCDWEAPSIYTTADDMSAYAREWCARAVAYRCRPKVYVGAGMPAKLDAVALYQLPFVGYWESQSDVSRVAICGYQTHQLFKYPTGQHHVSDIFPDAPPSVAGLLIDGDYTGCDFKGRRPRMIKLAA